jgi:uncharacterized SAM-binding protein YcdF (DUF218 family)
MKKIRRIKMFKFVIFCLFLLGVFTFASNFFHFQTPKFIKTAFERYLILPQKLPENTKADALYILGGSFLSTINHIETAVRLYKEGVTKSILIFNTSSGTKDKILFEDSSVCDKWEISSLEEYGVLRSDIECVPVKEGFFGTLSEAHDISKYLLENNYKSVILLSADCHTRRVFDAFSHFLKATDVQIYSTSSKAPFFFREMTIETVKVTVYKVILLFLPTGT